MLISTLIPLVLIMSSVGYAVVCIYSELLLVVFECGGSYLYVTMIFVINKRGYCLVNNLFICIISNEIENKSD